MGEPKWTSRYDVPAVMVEAARKAMADGFNECVSFYAAQAGIYAALTAVPVRVPSRPSPRQEETDA